MKNLKKARVNAEMNQTEMAEKLGVTQVTVSRWETGETYPSIETMLRISELLNVSVDYLLGKE